MVPRTISWSVGAKENSRGQRLACQHHGQSGGGSGATPNQCSCSFSCRPQPLQLLSLNASQGQSRFHVFGQVVISRQVGQDADLHLLAQPCLHGHVDIGHVGHHQRRREIQTVAEVAQTRLQKQHVTTVGWGGPSHQGNQQDRFRALRHPQPQSMFLVADEPPAFVRFSRCGRLRPPDGRNSGPHPFFKRVGRRRQIRRIHDGDGFAGRIQAGQNGSQQVVVDRAQLRQIKTISEQVQHLGVRQGSLVAQMGKASPRAVFRQQLDEQIERMHRRHQVEQEHAKQLSRRKETAATASPSSRKQIINDVIIQVRGERFL
jgi:hypothetical protein